MGNSKYADIRKIDKVFEDDGTILSRIYRCTRKGMRLEMWQCEYRTSNMPEDISTAIIDSITDSDMYLTIHNSSYCVRRLEDDYYGCVKRADIIHLFKKEKNGLNNPFVKALEDFLIDDEWVELRNLPVQFSIDEYFESRAIQRGLDNLLHYCDLLYKVYYKQCNYDIGVVIRGGRNGYFKLIYV